MTSTLAQYLIISLCIVFLAGSLARGDEGHGESRSSQTRSNREIATVVKDVESTEVLQLEEGENILKSYDEIQSKLEKRSKTTGEVESE